MKLILIAAFSLAMMDCRAQDSTGNARDTDIVFVKVEIEAEFPGGQPAWLRFLNKNLRYPNEAIGNNIQGNIIVQFKVDTHGNTSDIQAISGPRDGGLREEAERMIKLSGMWTPAVQNGHQVKSYKKKMISFKLVRG